jgi:hypothetical protein
MRARLEGIVSKRRDASYRSGRSPDWTGRDAHHRVDVTKLLESFVLVPNDEQAFDICVREGDGLRCLGSRPTVEECERAVESWTKSTYVKSSRPEPDLGPAGRGIVIATP